LYILAEHLKGKIGLNKLLNSLIVILECLQQWSF